MLRDNWRASCIIGTLAAAAIAAPLLAADLPNATFADLLGSTTAKNEDGIARALKDEQTLETASTLLASGALSAREEAELRNLRGWLLLEGKNIAEAIREFDAAIQAAPTNDEAYGKRGYAHLLNGDADRAQAELRASARTQCEFDLGALCARLVAARCGTRRGGTRRV